MKRLLKIFRVAVFIMALSVSINAGHILGGGAWCQCGCAACICDPGEHPGACTGFQSPQSDYSSLLGVMVVFALLAFRLKR
jgi:hypothetical protein